MEKTKKGLFKRFMPYLLAYKKTVAIDLLCASLTCVCDLVLPQILRTITDTAMNDISSLTAGLILKMAFIYLILRLIDAAAQYYMADMGLSLIHISEPTRRS